ncbi:MAG: carbamoyltransferase HypF, partial [Candidatus Margulisbacteria bacterium]|nr:carbamoyltransferase HypF [Candidatus Margulisiibacteriota bacterium]
GYAPSVVTLNGMNVEGLIAVGAEQKNCFAVGKGNEIILSQYIGDLKNNETFDFFKESLQRFLRLFRVKPARVIHDLHPDYLSTEYANSIKLPALAVQHHYAHIASCLAEHGLRENVIGISLDGTGLGADGNIWGGEFLTADLQGFERLAHLDYVQTPGGELAIKEPWRMAVAYLYHSYGKDFLKLNIPVVNKIKMQKIDAILTMMDKNINCPLTSSMGRLFDAVSALLGICLESRYEAEAAMLLEAEMNQARGSEGGRMKEEGRREKEEGRGGRIGEVYSYQLGNTIDLRPMIKAIVEDLQRGVENAFISLKFHNTVIKMIIKVAKKIRRDTAINKIVLSGGCFQNRYLLENTEIGLKKEKFEVYSHELVPTNDGGIALGQIAIGAAGI